ncbi:MAG: hypothetical protein MUC44_15200, partial [Beijerinckiaceae bacterium]|nr:hypothetical protein [Beijerinckiaceae bacterium]
MTGPPGLFHHGLLQPGLLHHGAGFLVERRAGLLRFDQRLGQQGDAGAPQQVWPGQDAVGRLRLQPLEIALAHIGDDAGGLIG